MSPDARQTTSEGGFAHDRAAGSVTFLFTDVEGSTRLVREVGAGVFGRILQEHDRLIRAAIEEAGGHVVDTQGDAFFAAFGDAASALVAAVAAQRAIGTHVWAGGARVWVRMGVHTGHPEVSEGRYLGLDVHLAARVAAAAHGGQILVSDVTESLVDGGGTEIVLRDLGEHILKDFDEPRRLFEVTAVGMLAGFPPPRAGATAEGAFSGREDELAEAALVSIVRAARRRERRRLLAILAAIAVPCLIVAGVWVTRASHVTVAPNSIAEIDPRTGAVVADVAIGQTPSRIVAGAGEVWVLNEQDQTITRIDAATRAATPVGLSQQPTDLAVSGSDVWVVDGIARTVLLLDTRNMTPVLTQRLNGPKAVLDSGDAGVAATPQAVWVSTGAGLAEYSTAGRFERLIRGVAHGAIAATPSAVWLGGSYGLFGSSQTLERINALTGHEVAQIPTGPVDAVAVGAGSVWTADTASGTVTRINPSTNKIVYTIRVPGVVALTTSGDTVWAAGTNGVLVQIDSAGRIMSRVTVGGSATGVAMAHGMLWVVVQPAARVRKGGGLRVTTVGPIDSPDPAFAFQALSWQVLYASDLNLLAYPDAATPAGLRLFPQAATTMPVVSHHGHTYTFFVRRGYRFSPPSGEPVTAGDFRTAIERAIKIGTRSFPTFMVSDIAGAKAYKADATRHVSGVKVHDQRISITTTDVNPALPAELALPLFSAVPPNASIRTNGNTAIPSAGPYYIKTYVPNHELILAKNPNYPGPRTAYLNTITYEISPHSSWQMVASGKADYDPGDATPPVQELAQLGPRSNAARSGHQRLFVNPAVGPQVAFFALNTHRPLFHHLAARQAVNYAIDRTALAATWGPPNASPTDQYLPSNMPGYPGNGRLYPLGAPDLHRAGTLMHQAGVRLPVRAVLFTVSNDPGAQVRAKLLTQELARIGIRLTVRTFSRPEQFSKDVSGRGFDIADEGFIFPVEDPAVFFTTGYRYLGLGPYHAALRQAARTFSPNRAAAFSAFDLTLAGRYAPLAAYAIPNSTDFFSARVGCHIIYQPVFGIDLTQLCLPG